MLSLQTSVIGCTINIGIVVTVPDIVVTVVVREVAQTGPPTPSPVNVTPPELCARARPFKVEPEFNSIAIALTPAAIIVPMN